MSFFKENGTLSKRDVERLHGKMLNEGLGKQISSLDISESIARRLPFDVRQMKYGDDMLKTLKNKYGVKPYIDFRDMSQNDVQPSRIDMVRKLVDNENGILVHISIFDKSYPEIHMLINEGYLIHLVEPQRNIDSKTCFIGFDYKTLRYSTFKCAEMYPDERHPAIPRAVENLGENNDDVVSIYKNQVSELRYMETLSNRRRSLSLLGAPAFEGNPEENLSVEEQSMITLVANRIALDRSMTYFDAIGLGLNLNLVERAVHNIEKTGYAGIPINSWAIDFTFPYYL